MPIATLQSQPLHSNLPNSSSLSLDTNMDISPRTSFHHHTPIPIMPPHHQFKRPKCSIEIYREKIGVKTQLSSRTESNPSASAPSSTVHKTKKLRLFPLPHRKTRTTYGKYTEHDRKAHDPIYLQFLSFGSTRQIDTKSIPNAHWSKQDEQIWLFLMLTSIIKFSERKAYDLVLEWRWNIYELKKENWQRLLRSEHDGAKMWARIRAIHRATMQLQGQIPSRGEGKEKATPHPTPLPLLLSMSEMSTWKDDLRLMWWGLSSPTWWNDCRVYKWVAGKDEELGCGGKGGACIIPGCRCPESDMRI